MSSLRLSQTHRRLQLDFHLEIVVDFPESSALAAPIGSLSFRLLPQQLPAFVALAFSKPELPRPLLGIVGYYKPKFESL